MPSRLVNGTWADADGVPVNAGREPSRGFATVNASGANLIPAVSGKRIRIYACAFGALVATSVKFQSNVTDISATFPLAANGGFVLPPCGAGWCETATGEALNLSMSVATTVGAQLIYEYL